jgi:histidyl-tRNA synthetase
MGLRTMVEARETLLCRGMRDLLPDEMARFRLIEQVFRDACRFWGYAEVRTPTIEHLYLFTSFGTLSPQLLGRVYSFLDWDGWTGERVVLRPDATIPVARLYRERMSGSRAKLAYVTNIFRFSAGEEPREVWQCGAELIGDSWPLGDLEQIAMALYAVRLLGLRNATLCLSHTGVVRALLEHAGFAAAEQAQLYDRILDGDEGVIRDLETRLPNLGAGLRLLAGTRQGGSAFISNLRAAFLPAVPGMAASLDELDLIAQAAVSGGVRVEVSVTDVRDFEYYTGPVFKLTVAGKMVASGGRYDRLTADSDRRPLPACGCALHVDALMMMVEPPEDQQHGTVHVVAADSSPGALAAALAAAQMLHAGGFSAALADSGAACRWRLMVTGDPGGEGCTLQDREHNKKSSGLSTAQVLDALRGSRP